MKFGLAQPVSRKEDSRFLTGGGIYVDDHAPDGSAHAFFLRSPVGHARIASIDAEEARKAPGVVGILTGADLSARVQNSLDAAVVKNRDGSDGAAPRRPAIADEKVCFVGEAVAIVVAETLDQARDAAEMIEIDYDELPAAYSTDGAANEPVVHPDVAPGNIAFDWSSGDEAAVKEAFAGAAHVVELPLVNNRVITVSMEPRACFAEWDADDQKLHFEYNGQGVWGLKAVLSGKMGLAPEKVRVTTPDVGGGFGMKNFPYPEHLAVAEAARAFGRPVRWISERTEAMLTDNMGRDHVTVGRAAFDADHKLLAIHFSVTAGMGAYNSAFAQNIPSNVARYVLPSVYDVQKALFEVKGVYTNTAPVDAYRGAGRPESIYQMDRLMDWAARELGVDGAELRRKNFIKPEQLPYKTVVGELYDSGDFSRVMDRLIEESDWNGFDARKAESADRGLLRGRGMCYYIESILGAPNETAKIAFAEDGMVDLYVGTMSNGQGHETVYAQFLHERAGIPFEKIRMIQGDSDLIAQGGGTGGSRSVTTQGNAINATADEIIRKFRPLAEEELEAAAADINFDGGEFRVAGTDKSVTLLHLADVARKKGMTDLLTTQEEAVLPGRSFPNGCHAAEVEIDPETGETKVVKYTVVDDFGVLINPMLAEGQVHGGVVQGIGQAITEHVVYDESGQLLTATFMDYAIPRAGDTPWIPFHHEGSPSKANDIGMKGCGEAGTVGALAAIANAGLDALAPAGVKHIDMPFTPQRVWNWIESAKQAAE